MKKQFDHKIDEMFSDAFKDFEVKPPKQIWDNVKAQIPRSINLVNPKKSFLYFKSTYIILSASLVAVIITAIYLYTSLASFIASTSAAMPSANDHFAINSIKETPIANNTVNADITKNNNSSASLARGENKNATISQNSSINPANADLENEAFSKNANVSLPVNANKNISTSKNDFPAEKTNDMKGASDIVSHKKTVSGSEQIGLSGKAENPLEKTSLMENTPEKLSMITVLKIHNIPINETGKFVISNLTVLHQPNVLPRNHPRIYFGLHYTPEWVFDLPENNSPVKPKENNFSQSAQISFNYDLNKFTFQSGIGYSLYNNNTSAGINHKSIDSVGYYNDVYYFSYDSVTQSTDLFFTQVTLYDTVAHMSIKESKNKYRYFQIPFIIGYKYYSKRFFFSGSIGAGLGILSYKSEPVIAFDENNAELINIEKYSPAVTKTYWQIMGGIGCGYFITDNISFAIEPAFKYYLNPLFEQDIKKHPYSIGIRTGMYLKF